MTERNFEQELIHDYYYDMENGSTGHLNIFLNDGRINTRYEEWHEQST